MQALSKQEPDYLVTFLVPSIFVIWVFPLHFTSVNKITESSVIFLWNNGVLICNCKENKEAGAICFEIRISRKKNKKLLQKVPSKIYGSYSIIEKNKKNIFWSVNNSKYHQREMGLLKKQTIEKLYIKLYTMFQLVREIRLELQG